MASIKDFCKVQSDKESMWLPHTANHIIEWVDLYPQRVNGSGLVTDYSATRRGQRAKKAMCICGEVFDLTELSDLAATNSDANTSSSNPQSNPQEQTE